MYTIKRNKLLSASMMAAMLATGLMSQGVAADGALENYRYINTKVGWTYAPDAPESEHSKALKAKLREGQSDSGFHYVGGERGWVYAPDKPESAESRAFKAARTAGGDTGFRYVGGERGWIYAPDEPVSAEARAFESQRSKAQSGSGGVDDDSAG